MEVQQRARAVVVGGSVAGLGAAAMLAGRFDEVVVVERRPWADGAGVAAHARLPHVMLMAGSRVLESLFPGFATGLLARGADGDDVDPTRISCYWAAAGTVRDHLAVPDLGFPRAMGSRALVETALRRVTLSLPNVTAQEGTVTGLRTRGRRVVGVRLAGGTVLEADLVVDASGRMSSAAAWMEAAGLDVPETTEVGVDLRYTAYVVERRVDDFDGGAFAVVQNDASTPRIGVALPMEGERWQVAFGGYFGAAAPVDPSGARVFAQHLATPGLAMLFDRPYLAEPARFTFRSSRRRHWERLRPMPGFCAIGDSVASFNPIYGQGMSSALLQAEALGRALDIHPEGARLVRAAARGAAAVVANPWTVATGGDFVYPGTVGRRPPGSAGINRYVESVTRAAATDERANRALSAVQQLLAPPATLFRPPVVAAVLARRAESRTRLAIS